MLPAVVGISNRRGPRRVIIDACGRRHYRAELMFFVRQFACNASFPAVAHATEEAGTGGICPTLERASRKQGATRGRPIDAGLSSFRLYP